MSGLRTAGELLRAYYAALDRPTLDDLDTLLDPDCDWSFPGSRLRGPAPVKKSMARSLSRDLTMNHAISHLLDQGDVAICELVATNRLGDETFTIPGAVVCEARDGRIIRIAAYPEAETMKRFMRALAPPR